MARAYAQSAETVERTERWTLEPRWKEKALELLVAADIRVGGGRPWDLQVHDERLWHRALTQGNLGLGEAYMEGWWDTPALDQFFHRLIASGAPSRVTHGLPDIVVAVKARLLDLQRRQHATDVAGAHNDLGHDLFAHMLDKRMMYACAYWDDARTLEKAQLANLNLIAKKLHLRPGMTVLDIGCGWGGLAEHLARQSGCRVVGLTSSRDQAERARQRTQGLDVDIRLAEPHDLQGQSFDRIVSLNLLETLGPRQYSRFFRSAHQALSPDGLMLLQTATMRRTSAIPDTWTNRYVHPSGHVPSLQQVSAAAENGFVVEDAHNLGPHYDRTLMAWHANFTRHWKRMRDGYGETFRRMWEYHLLSSAGAYRAGARQCHQLVLARGRGMEGGYRPVR